MKPNILLIVPAFLCLLLFGVKSYSQTFGTLSSAVWLSDCNQSNFYNTSGNPADLPGPAGNVFTNANLGVHTQNSATLILRGAEVRTSKEVVANVCSVRMFYRIYLQSAVPGAFNSIDLPKVNDCDIPSSQFPSGGPCAAGDQKWNRVIPDGATTPYAPVNLTSFVPGNYVLEVYYDVAGSSTTTTLCDETILLDNAGNNYKAFFSIQAPILASYNPTTCHGTEGYITISGLMPGASYSVTYSDDGVPVGPVTLVANGSGQVAIIPLNAGVYSDFEITINGCTTNLFTGIILSDPVFTPTFPPIAPFCAGTTPPILPSVSNNGLAGTWNPAVINNQSSGNYTFTPVAGHCGLSFTRSVTVIQRTTPTFSFSTSLSICTGAVVPPLPNNSINGFTGTWSPSAIDNQNSATYTFTPNTNQCANPTTLTVTVNPILTTTFGFGTVLTICAGQLVPQLVATSSNGITGTWSPASVDNQNSGTYTFTPNVGQCGTIATFDVTVNPNITPTFDPVAPICSGAALLPLPTSSTNATPITGTWSPALNNTATTTYTFTPDIGLCATTTTLMITVNPNVTPTFDPVAPICSGAILLPLPTTSTNAIPITGTWSPALNNTATTTYTFTPDFGLCATTTTLTIAVNPNVIPTFNPVAPICSGAALLPLPTSSTNATPITGTWSPALNNTATTTYTFTPDIGLCATTATLIITVNPNVTPTFDPVAPICSGAALLPLPTSSTNATPITGTWSPALNNTATTTYTFTPDIGQCGTTTTLTIAVNPNVIPTFDPVATICSGAALLPLPTSSTNATPITGTWSPALNNTATTTYTFTPDIGQCGTTATLTIAVNPNVIPTFDPVAPICSGAALLPLPTSSTNATPITGTWSPALNNTATTTYTFTPDIGLCATTTTLMITVNPNVTPTFDPVALICSGAILLPLPTTSTNAIPITGTWSPALNNTATTTYTFTPDFGLCATTTTLTIAVNPNVIPTFDPVAPICSGAALLPLPTSSTNATPITGTWSPALNNTATTTYTFTPDIGLCATTATLIITVNPNVTPTFDPVAPICSGAALLPLPTSSTNATPITGTWSPALNNTATTTYTFTPTPIPGVCAIPATFIVTVNPNITPTFDFGTSLTICTGGTVPPLPTTSDNTITGSWSPTVVSNQASDTYTFTPTAGLCATTTTFTVTVNPILTTTFSIGTDLTICSGNSVPTLAPVSDNGINGTWSPATIDNQASGIYTFTPATGQCGTTATFTVTVTPSITPTFNFGPSLTICKGSAAPILPTTSINGYDGVWTPAVVSNQDTGLYTFTPVAPPAQCITTITLKVNVNPILTPTFSFGNTLSICSGTNVPPLPTTSTNNITGTWSPAVVSNQASGVYTFTSTAGQCAVATATFTVTVNPTPTVTTRSDTTVNDGALIPVTNFSETPGGVSYSWTNSNPAIGLPASGTGNTPSFTAINRGNDPISSTITVTPTFNGCTGTAKSYTITVKTLNKDVFVPNVFSPNGDGKNDVLFVYGNYIQKLEMRIFNQWGEQVEHINEKAKGWDGSHRGKQQPVGVYVYVLQAELSDGRKVNLKGSITLVR